VQSVYGAAHWLGAPAAARLDAPPASSCPGAGLLALWRSPAPYALKAAALPLAALMLSPYSLIYDFPDPVISSPS
jgi:hypothetical protein